MSESFEWRVGEPDDCDNATIMRLGIAARKSALNNFRAIPAIDKEQLPQPTEKQLIEYQLQGMVQLAAYSAVLCEAMLDDLGMSWAKQPEEGDNKDQPTLERVLHEVGIISNLFSKRLTTRKNNND